MTGAAPVSPLFAVASPAVAISAVKLADDGSGDVIVRVYESSGARTRTTLQVGLDTTSVIATDLLERPLADSPSHEVTNGEVTLSLRPFELRTLRFSCTS